jgi:hypothetical protein
VTDGGRFGGYLSATWNLLDLRRGDRAPSNCATSHLATDFCAPGTMKSRSRSPGLSTSGHFFAWIETGVQVSSGS